ncbi:hypothetical protein MYOV085v1_p0122 [Vibrio phage 355E48.1]|nr:hypothetical protein MYOV085v1_p0122 [Vibrio phage 355E48.1]
MSDAKTLKQMLADIEAMTDEELIKALQEAPDYGIGELFEDSWLDTVRREQLGKRMNEQKLECPECNTRQVQLIGYMETYPAQWKCRKCKHKFEWEGV